MVEAVTERLPHEPARSQAEDAYLIYLNLRDLHRQHECGDATELSGAFRAWLALWVDLTVSKAREQVCKKNKRTINNVK